jgi:hypothetical protein
MRSRENPARTGSFHGIVLLGKRNRVGERLHGARAEAGLLHRRYSGIEIVREVVDSTDAAVLGTLGRADLLHVAAHTELDDRHPWRSGIMLDSRWGTGKSLPIRAEMLARSSLRERLVFLSGCESAGGEVLPGEGVLGLSSAFLAAGVPCLVATLWPIEDRSAARFVRLFYESVEKGRTAGDALQQARRTMAATEYHDPYYWSGFVLVGEPDMRLELRRRTPKGPVWIGGGVLLAAAALIVRRRRSSRFRKTL